MLFFKQEQQIEKCKVQIIFGSQKAHKFCISMNFPKFRKSVFWTLKIIPNEARYPHQRQKPIRNIHPTGRDDDNDDNDDDDTIMKHHTIHEMPETYDRENVTFDKINTIWCGFGHFESISVKYPYLVHFDRSICHSDCLNIIYFRSLSGKCDWIARNTLIIKASVYIIC